MSTHRGGAENQERATEAGRKTVSKTVETSKITLNVLPKRDGKEQRLVEEIILMKQPEISGLSLVDSTRQQNQKPAFIPLASGFVCLTSRPE